MQSAPRLTPAEQLEKANRQVKCSHLEKAFAFSLKHCGHDLFEQEYKFARDAVGHGAGIRKRLNAANLKDWRFDFADKANMIAVEIEGGVFVGGRHVNGAGFRADAIKYNEAQIMGWTVLRFTDREVKTGEAIRTLNRLYRAMEKRGDLHAFPGSLTI